ncbi:MAG: hypothetical protein CO108_25750 [Deltaproteobacteria bacterium CG_4_9_14_3_um_filter_63_12]|nr:MAG: hypothetical protein CO108_25750 [Deltaproteobacteria bacterium CG_4_9_14_3_um_filter_63_12]
MTTRCNPSSAGATLTKYDDDSSLPPGEFEPSDLQAAKRELIKLGLDQGYLTQAVIESYLPIAHMSDSEIEMIYFTFETMGIAVEGVDHEN